MNCHAKAYQSIHISSATTVSADVQTIKIATAVLARHLGLTSKSTDSVPAGTQPTQFKELSRGATFTAYGSDGSTVQTKSNAFEGGPEQCTSKHQDCTPVSGTHNPHRALACIM